MRAWLESSLVRVYPGTSPRRQDSIALSAARGETVSFQAAFNTAGLSESAGVSAEVGAADGIKVTIRRVGLVPMPQFNTETEPEELEGIGHIPGEVPDPLFPENTMTAEPDGTYAFWITLEVDLDAPPGTQTLPILLNLGGKRVELQASIRVRAACIAPREDFPVCHLIHADAICQWYDTELWRDSFWKLFENYLADATAHGQDSCYVPLFTPPLDGVKRPTQLLKIRKTALRYEFDWSLVRRWLALCRKHGIKYFEFTHLFTQWGAQKALRVYHQHGEKGELLWPGETEALSPVYKEFLVDFLPKFRRFLQKEHLTHASFFHISDEPQTAHIKNYRAVRRLITELAPWMKTIDALSDVQFARQRLVDVPIPIVSSVPEFVKWGFKPWVYFCCLPRGRYLNRLLDTPLQKIRMSGWLFQRTRVQGFLHWGYNYWYRRETTELVDPFKVTDGGAWPLWAHGDPFVVYPGKNGPVDSVRWEVFAESLQDLALLQQAGVGPDDPMLAEIKDYADFPRSAEWIQKRREKVLDILDSRWT